MKERKTALRKNRLREIWRTKSRFIAIFAIIGISVGFFSGLKSAAPSMLATALHYFDDTQLMDIRLVSTIGFSEEDVEALYALDYVQQAMPGYFADLIVTHNNVDTVARVYSVPATTKTNRSLLNEPILKEGRMPQGEGECVMERYLMDMAGYHLGDTIEFNTTVNGKDTLSYVKHLQYKIVGLVDSPLYLTYLRGNTNIGDGTIAFYMLLPPEEFAFERYTVVYLRTDASQEAMNDLSEAYRDAIDDEKERLETFSAERIRHFNDTTLSEAQQKLTDGRREYEEKKAKALQKLLDGEKELTDGEREFYEKTGEGRRSLEEAEQELAEGKQQLRQGQEDYQKGLEEGRKKLEDGQAQYNEGLAQYEAGKLTYDTQIEQAEKQLAAAQAEFQMQYQIFYTTTKPQAESQLSLLKNTITIANNTVILLRQELSRAEKDTVIGRYYQQEIDELKAKLDEALTLLADYEQQYEDGVQQLADGEAQLLAGKQQLEEAQQQFLTQKAEGAAQLNAAKAQLDAAAAQLESGKLAYEQGVSSGLLELQAAQEKLTEGEAQLAAGKVELEEQSKQGMLTMKAAREKLQKGRYEAHVQLADAEKQLQDAEEQLEALQDPKWYVYDRSDNPGYSGLEEDADRVDSIAAVFPVFFLLIAALVCFTTMARMVEERRTETGTLKALGYSNRSIAQKYLIYGGTAALAGSIVGGLIGELTLPVIIVDTYGIMYILPPTILSVHWSSLLISSLAGIVCICLVSMMAVYKDLKLSPAALMRPKAPKPGKRILLEYIKPLWRHMSFTSKVTARNLFRYKARFFMTVVGVAGCTALMVAALGLRDSTTSIATLQFDELTRYDQIFALSESDTADKKAYLMSRFHADERFEYTLLGYMDWATIQKENGSRSMSLRITIGQDQSAFREMFILRDRRSQAPLTLDDDGIIIGERISEVLGLKVGDTVTLTLDNEKYACRVAGLTENYAGSIGYMTPACYERLTGHPLKYGLVFTRTAAAYKEQEKDAANDYMKDDDVITVTSITDQVNTMLNMMTSLDFVILVMIFCAGMLAMVVLYNLTNINIAERVREIATIKVLGFYSLETANFIYRESIALTIIGGLCGMGLGSVFATFIVEAIQMDNVMFPKLVSFQSYLIGFVLTLLFSLLVNFMMYFKMNRISMVESLKSVE